MFVCVKHAANGVKNVARCATRVDAFWGSTLSWRAKDAAICAKHAAIGRRRSQVFDAVRSWIRQ